MATVLKNPGIIIKSGSEKAFFSRMRGNQLTKEFWSDCQNIRKNINKQSMAELNAFMDRKDE